MVTTRGSSIPMSIPGTSYFDPSFCTRPGRPLQAEKMSSQISESGSQRWLKRRLLYDDAISWRVFTPSTRRIKISPFLVKLKHEKHSINTVSAPDYYLVDQWSPPLNVPPMARMPFGADVDRLIAFSGLPRIPS